MKIEEAIKQSKFENSYQKAIINIIYTANWLRDQEEEFFKIHNILPQHYNVLRIVKGKHPKVISPGEIKEVMLDKGNDVTRLVDKLVKRGFLARKTCENNRRKIDIAITTKGIDFLKSMNEPFKKQMNELKKQLDEKDAEKLSNLLDKFRI